LAISVGLTCSFHTPFRQIRCYSITEASQAGGIFDRQEEKKRLAPLQAEFKSNLNLQQGGGILGGESTSFTGTMDEGASGGGSGSV
jgi:hypothetical protein